MNDKTKVIIMGAAGRDFHNFLCCYREDPHTEVVAFTAAQIPSIAERRYPASFAGPSYPDGIPMYPETDLERLITTLHVDEVVFWEDLHARWPAWLLRVRGMARLETALRRSRSVIRVCSFQNGSCCSRANSNGAKRRPPDS